MNLIIRTLKVFLVFSVLMSAIGFSFQRDSTSIASAATTEPIVTDCPPDEFCSYIPITYKGYPRLMTQFGAQVLPYKSEKAMGLMKDADVYWMRVNAINWNEIEPIRTEPPTYHWEMVNEASLSYASLNGMQVIATIRFAPAWAQKIPGYECGPIAQDKLDEYAQFLKALVQRYSYPPYNIKYWELGNEPDIDPTLPPDGGSGFGCWGDINDPYYGGRYYAEMLKVAYPAIKSVDPTAQVLNGGLLLDCDPNDPPPDRGCLPAYFMEGILVNGGGPYFDIVSFHGYPTYTSTSPDGELYYDTHFPGWRARGGVVLGKVSYLREMLAKYGYNKPIMHTEGSLICPEVNTTDCAPPTPAFFQSQADYVVWLYVRNIATGLKGTIWYQFNGPGWRNGGMLDENQNPRPAYYALDFLTQELKGASFTSQITQYSPLVGYEFRSSAKKIWVLWSSGASTYSIQLPGGVQLVYDKYGDDITPLGSGISVKSPIYVEFNP